MGNTYFVLYKRDRSGETLTRAKGRLLYDRVHEFTDKTKATAFGLTHLEDTPIVARTVTALEEYVAGARFVVAAYFPSKYVHEDYVGDRDAVPTHEVVQCDLNDLDATVELLASEKPSKLYLGIEEKLLPSPLDRVRSVNQVN